MRCGEKCAGSRGIFEGGYNPDNNPCSETLDLVLVDPFAVTVTTIRQPVPPPW